MHTHTHTRKKLNLLYAVPSAGTIGISRGVSRPLVSPNRRKDTSVHVGRTSSTTTASSRFSTATSDRRSSTYRRIRNTCGAAADVSAVKDSSRHTPASLSALSQLAQRGCPVLFSSLFVFLSQPSLRRHEGLPRCASFADFRAFRAAVQCVTTPHPPFSTLPAVCSSSSTTLGNSSSATSDDSDACGSGMTVVMVVVSIVVVAFVSAPSEAEVLHMVSFVIIEEPVLSHI